MNKRKVKKDVKKSVLLYPLESCPADMTIDEVYKAFMGGIIVYSELEGNGAKPILYGNRIRHIRWQNKVDFGYHRRLTANHPPPSAGSPVPLPAG